MLTLYSKETTSFSTLGIGVLRDFISHPLITEELNGAYTLEFEYAKDGYLSEYLIEQNIIKADGQAFRIWNIKKDMQKITVFAKHIFFDLSFNFLADVFPTNLTAQSALAWMLNRAAVATNFSATGNCTQTASTRYVRKNFIDAVFNEDNALLKKFGGELSYDNFNITVHDHRGTNANFSIRYKKNLTGIDFNLDFSNVATRIVPIGFDGLTIDSTYVESPRASNYFTPLYKTYEFNDIKYDPDDEEAYHTLAEAKQALINAANELFTKNVDLPQVSIGVNFVELSKCSEYASYSNLERVHLGDTIDVIIPELNIHTSARVNKTVYDCILGRFITLEIGSAKQSITRTQIVIENQIRKSENYLTQAQQNAENLINHPFNGNVYIDKENGVIYLMDSTSPETAQNVWKWSLGGLGFSSTGINGTYTVAILQDGRINANFITTGQLDTGVIQGYDSLLIQVDTLDREFQKEINPTGTASGSSITLEDSAETELIDFELEGNTTQETRSGINLLNITATSTTTGGVTFTVNKDKSITINGTNTSDQTIWYRLAPNFVVSAGSYTLSNGNSNVSDNTFIFVDDGWGFARRNISNATFSVDTTVKPYIKVSSGATINNQTIYPMIVKGTYLEDGSNLPTYEQYGASPSPDYPSELVNVGYQNLLNVDKSNIVSPTTETGFRAIMSVNNGVIIFNGSPTTSGGTNMYFGSFRVKESGDYRLSTNMENPPTDSSANMILQKSSDNSNWSTLFEFTSSNGIQTTMVSLDKSMYYRLRFYGQSTTIFTNTIFKPMLTKGITNCAFIPYGKYGIEVKINGNNLKDNATWYSGYLNNNNQVVSNSGWKYSDYIDISNGKYNYTSAGTGNAPKTVLYNQNKQPIAYLDIAVGTTDLSSYNASYIRISVANDAFSGLILKRQENTHLYTLDNPLRSIGDTKDLLYIKNGMLYVERRIGSVILDGSEVWSGLWAGDGGKYVYICLDALSNSKRQAGATNNIICKSNYYPATHYDGGTGSMWALRSNDNYPYLVTIHDNTNSSAVGRIAIKNLDISTTSTFKSWLSTHNTEVQYLLAEPYTEELGQVDMPSTYKGITYLNTTDELEPNMNITYVRDTVIANYVESHVNEIKITEKGIESRVQTIEAGDYGTRINAVEERTTDTEHSIDIISTNIDTTTGEVRRVTTTTGFTFNEDGMSIEDSSSNFKALHRNTGTTYYDGNTIVGQYTKDGSKQKDLDLFGVYTYGKNDINDTPMFIAQLFTDGNGEEGFGHFYNRGD